MKRGTLSWKAFDYLPNVREIGVGREWKAVLLPRRSFSLENDYPSFGSASLENDNITLQSGALHSIKSMFFCFSLQCHAVYSTNVQEFYETVWSEGWRLVRPHEHWFQTDSRNNPRRLRMNSVFDHNRRWIFANRLWKNSILGWHFLVAWWTLQQRWGR